MNGKKSTFVIVDDPFKGEDVSNERKAAVIKWYEDMLKGKKNMNNDLLWTEDDCTRNTEGHEDEIMAWKRLGLGDFPGYETSKEVDHGDCMEYRFANGISVWNIHGAYHEITKTRVLSKDMPPQPGDNKSVNDEKNSPTWGELFGRKKS